MSPCHQCTLIPTGSKDSRGDMKKILMSPHVTLIGICAREPYSPKDFMGDMKMTLMSPYCGTVYPQGMQDFRPKKRGHFCSLFRIYLNVLYLSAGSVILIPINPLPCLERYGWKPCFVMVFPHTLDASGFSPLLIHH